MTGPCWASSDEEETGGVYGVGLKSWGVQRRADCVRKRRKGGEEVRRGTRFSLAVVCF
jgi:hypothetical protein